MMKEVKFYKCMDDHLLKFAVIAARANGKWVFCKHRKRHTLEIPGGHREAGESIDQAAKRELFEETGAIEYEIRPICVYSVINSNDESFGMLYYAEISKFENELHNEIEKILLLDKYPTDWTYPEIQPKLLKKVQEMITR